MKRKIIKIKIVFKNKIKINLEIFNIHLIKNKILKKNLIIIKLMITHKIMNFKKLKEIQVYLKFRLFKKKKSKIKHDFIFIFKKF